VPGQTTREIDLRAAERIASHGAEGLFKGYRQPGTDPFPANLCLSVNEVVVHGIGNDRPLREGDIVGADCGVRLKGWCGDAATTVMVGRVAPRVGRLCEVTRHLLDIAAANMKPGRRWSHIARLMQRYAESSGLSVVRKFVGHGVGVDLHEDPQVPNYVDDQTLKADFELVEGMVLAVEPMCNLGVADTTVDPADGWTVRTADGEPSAHYEHTIAITATGADILTDGR
jgi:methionyl aminopeptidase